MASAAELALLITGKLDSSVGRSFDEASGKASTFGQHFKNVSEIAAGFALGTGITRAAEFLTNAAHAAIEDEASVSRLRTAVENTGASYASYAGRIDEVIKRGQDLAFTDDQTRDALSILAAQTSDTEEAIRRLALAQDLSRGANIDLTTAARLLGKVTDENVTALNRYGIRVEKGATETELFAAVYEKFHGQAQTFADSTAGKMERMTDQWHEFEEQVGRVAIPTITKGLDLFTMSIQGWGVIFDTAGSQWDSLMGRLGRGSHETVGYIGDISGAMRQLATVEMPQIDTAAIRNAQSLAALGMSASVTMQMLNEGFVGIGTNIQRPGGLLAGLEAVTKKVAEQHDVVVQANIDTQLQKQFQNELTKSLVDYEQEVRDSIRANELQFAATRNVRIEMGLEDMQGRATAAGLAIMTREQMYSEQSSRDMTIATRMARIELGLMDSQGRVTAQGFREMVDAAKDMLIQSEAMSKATEQARKELGLQDTAAKETAKSYTQVAKATDEMTSSYKSYLAAHGVGGGTPISGLGGGGSPSPTAPAPSSGGGASAGFPAPPGTHVGPGMFSYGTTPAQIAAWYAAHPGQYASGLDYVPYDNFPAILHKGERVLTASEARGGGGLHIHFHGDVYGFNDFRSVVGRAVRDVALSGGFYGTSLVSK